MTSDHYSRENIYLIGQISTQIVGNKLPSKRQVLKVLFFNLRVANLSLRESAKLILKEIFVFWEKARLLTHQEPHCITKVEKLYNDLRNLQKSSSRPKNLAKENHFISELDDLFDIAHADVNNHLDPMRIEFLANQRKKGRVGYICDIEGMYDLLEEQEMQKILLEKQRLDKSERDKSSLLEKVEWASSSDGDSQTFSQRSVGTYSNVSLESDDETGEPANKKSKESRGNVNIMNERVVAVLDKCKISDREAVHLIASIAHSLQVDLKTIVLNRSSIRRYRQKLREARALHIKKVFNDIPLDSAVLHWDGKLLPDLDLHKTVDRLPVLITNGDIEKLLGVPKLIDGKGSTQADALFDIIEDWGLSSKIKALCCDTTPSNLGHLNGAAAILEKILETDILYLPCRHHVFELVLKCVFDIKIKTPSSGPAVPLFKRFSESWKNIDENSYRAGIEEAEVRKFITDNDIIRIKTFLRKMLLDAQPRDDYREMLLLTQIFLGDIPPEGAKFYKPGPIHHARFMAKALYCLKMFLFRDNFSWSKGEKKGVQDICIFLVTTYVEAWFSSPIAAKSPNHDLQFLKKLNNYKYIDPEISNVSVKKFINHLWYLHPETVAFSFFDDTLSLEMKRRMIVELKEAEEIETVCPKRISLKLTDVDNFCKHEINYFVTSQTKNFFTRFEIDSEFLNIDPSLWIQNENFRKGHGIVTKLKVVNDTAERAIRLIEEYNTILTKNEDQKQFSLQLIEEYRRKYNDPRKQTLLEQH